MLADIANLHNITVDIYQIAPTATEEELLLSADPKGRDQGLVWTNHEDPTVLEVPNATIVDFPNDDTIHKTAAELVDKIENIVEETTNKLSKKLRSDDRATLLHKIQKKTFDMVLTQGDYADVFHDILTDFRAGLFDDELV